MTNKKRKYQAGGMVQPVWQDLYGSWLQNQNGQLTNQLPLQGNTLQEVQVTAQSLGQRPPMGYQEPQPLPINNQVQAQPFQQSQLPYQGGFQAPQEDPGMSQQQASSIGGGIASAATTIGGIFDTLGDLKKGLIVGGSSILNSLISDNNNPRKRATQFSDNQNRYGSNYQVLYENGGEIAKSGVEINPAHKGDFTAWAKRNKMSVQQAAQHVMVNKEDYSPHVVQMANFAKNAAGWNKAEDGATLSSSKAKEILRDGTIGGKKITKKQQRYFGWIAGGGEAKNGAVVQEYGFGDPIPNITSAQEAALNQFIPYPAPQQVTPINQGSFSKSYGDPTTGYNATAGNNYSGWVADWSKIGAPVPGQFDPYGQSYLPDPNGGYRINQNRLSQMQFGGSMVNNTGYLQSAPQTNQQDYNVIPNQRITTQGMNQPILANGVPLFPNEGDYMFNQSPVVEQKYQVGQELDLDAKTIKKLKSMGYEFE